MRRFNNYIYEQSDWPRFKWSDSRLITLLPEVRNIQGMVIGKMRALGFELQNQANLEILTQDVLKSTEIEGEILNPEQVRSSIARRLGLDISGLVHSDRNVDGVVEMMLDATGNYDKPLTKERLFGWHNALFPTGFGGIYKIIIGSWRDDSTGPMQVVSGPMGKERVHYQAPAAELLDKQMRHFFKWINDKQQIDLIVKAAIAHLWFITLHPFEDGNGRIARAITDMILAQSDKDLNYFLEKICSCIMLIWIFQQVQEHSLYVQADHSHPFYISHSQLKNEGVPLSHLQHSLYVKYKQYFE